MRRIAVLARRLRVALAVLVAVLRCCTRASDNAQRCKVRQIGVGAASPEVGMGTRMSGSVGRGVALVAVSSLLAVSACASVPISNRSPGAQTPTLSPSTSAGSSCTAGSVSYSLASHPLTVAYRLSRMPSTVSIAVMDINNSEPPRYGTPDGLPFKKGGDLPFDIYTPWNMTLVKQVAGDVPPKVYSDGGSIGCDALNGTMSWSLKPGTRAIVVSAPPLETPVPTGWLNIMWTWEVVGDRILIPQPPETIGDALDVQPVTAISYNGEKQDGSSISLTLLEQYIQQKWQPRTGS